MGYKQGVNNLRTGVVRRPAPHEIRRGYVFISKAKRLPEFLDVKDFQLEMPGKVYPSRKIDVSGRARVPREFLESIGATQGLHITIVSNKTLRLEVVNTRG